ncbi:hypothetical protein pipiens_019364 [Culex pipiens pipiens]|uniref:Uncharacterized protein n=1 Tax=Culex pipiens pipiens TaxID=38569 RepID=A0ABD1DUL6_CULPP
MDAASTESTPSKYDQQGARTIRTRPFQLERDGHGSPSYALVADSTPVDLPVVRLEGVHQLAKITQLGDQ